MFTSPASLETFVFAAGIGQLLLVTGSPAIPVLLHWRRDLAPLPPLLRRLFWVYAAYILATNFAFGLLSALDPAALLDGSTLALAVSAFIACYWTGRLAVQFACFDRAVKPRGSFFTAAEVALTGLFVFLTLTYVTATMANVRMVLA